MSIITIGIDLAKNVFAVHGVDENGKAALIKPKVARDQLLLLIANLPPCLIGMEACSQPYCSVNQHAVFASKQRALFPIVRMPSMITRGLDNFFRGIFLIKSEN
jgi:transposase